MSPKTQFVKIGDKYICTCMYMYIHANVLVSNFYTFCYCGHFITFCKLLAVELYTVQQ